MRTGPRPAFRWTRENVVYAIDLWHRRHLYAPTVAEWEQAGENHPCRQTVQRLFGSWSGAIAAAGLRPRRQGEPRRRSHRHRCPDTGRFLPNAQ
jgi:hypothetical protein